MTVNLDVDIHTSKKNENTPKNAKKQQHIENQKKAKYKNLS